MGMLVYIGGVPGVGKSTLVKEVMKELDSDFDVVSMGTLMFEEARDRGYVTSRDELSSLDKPIRLELQQYCVDTVCDMREGEKNMIIDSHYANRTESGLEPAFSEENIKKLSADLYTVVMASPEEIYTWREQDESRNRRVQSTEEIGLDQSIELNYATTFSALSGGNLEYIMKHEGLVEEKAEYLVGAIRQLQSELGYEA